MPEITLTMDGKRHQGWESISITRSIERVASAFDLGLSHRWGKGAPPAIRAGMPCTVHIDNELLISGHCDGVSPSYDDTTHSIAVQGRSATADLVDCSLSGQEFKNLTLTQIASKLCQPFGITVLALVDVGAPFKVARLANGQPIFDFLEQLARIRAVRLVTDPKGRLVITTAGTAYADTALVFGDNIRAASGSNDTAQRFSQYTVTAQQDGLNLNAEGQANVSGGAADTRMGRYRPITIETDTPADIGACTQRAEWERNTRFGRGQGVVYTVSGWQQTPGGRTWQPNELVQVVDPWQGINGERLITEVRSISDLQGEHSEITVLPRAAFVLIPLPEPEEEDLFT